MAKEHLRGDSKKLTAPPVQRQRCSQASTVLNTASSSRSSAGVQDRQMQAVTRANCAFVHCTSPHQFQYVGCLCVGALAHLSIRVMLVCMACVSKPVGLSRSRPHP